MSLHFKICGKFYHLRISPPPSLSHTGQSQERKEGLKATGAANTHTRLQKQQQQQTPKACLSAGVKIYTHFGNGATEMSGREGDTLIS